MRNALGGILGGEPGWSVTDFGAGTIAISVAILRAIGLLAGFLPARKASRVEPMIALRRVGQGSSLVVRQAVCSTHYEAAPELWNGVPPRDENSVLLEPRRAKKPSVFPDGFSSGLVLVFN